MAERKINWLLLLPPVIFLSLGLAFALGLSRENPNELPSALQNTAAPVLDLPALLTDVPTPGADALTAPGVKLVNFWASWCGPCRAEHPTLERLAKAGLPIIGVNYKDNPNNARKFLAELGNPYVQIGTDKSGRTGIDWGLYGVPETFVIDGDGKIVMRYPGPVTKRILAERILPAIEAAGGSLDLE